MFIWDFVADTILGQIVDWIYGQVMGFLGNFFAEMEMCIRDRVDTIPGQMVIAVCIAAVFVSFAFVVKLTQPIEYRR